VLVGAHGAVVVPLAFAGAVLVGAHGAVVVPLAFAAGVGCAGAALVGLETLEVELRLLCSLVAEADDVSATLPPGVPGSAQGNARLRQTDS